MSALILLVAVGPKKSKKKKKIIWIIIMLLYVTEFVMLQENIIAHNALYCKNELFFFMFFGFLMSKQDEKKLVKGTKLKIKS